MTVLTFDTLQDLQIALDSDQGPKGRITQAYVADQTVWIKRPEVLPLRMRLQKGDPVRAFAAEQSAHKRFADQNLPVPPLLLTASTYTVTANIGGNLAEVMRTHPQKQSADLITMAALALAQFHNAGTYHGRPNLKDICWDGTDIRFIDFERAGKHSPEKGMAEDVIMFVFNIFAEAQGDYAPLPDVMYAYRQDAPNDVFQNAAKRAARFRHLSWLTWPIRQKKRAWEFKAIPRTLAFFRNKNPQSS
ncbi:MAG: hypothetical protein ACPG5U_06450 [Planktomarina sp.]